MHVDTPVGNTLPDMVITVIVCVIVEKIAAAVKEKIRCYHPTPINHKTFCLTF